MNTSGVVIPQIGTHIISDVVAEKAATYLDENRVVLGPRGSNWALVVGSSGGNYFVRCFVAGCSCTCPHGRTMRSGCSHIVAALVMWEERPGMPVDFEPEVGEQLEMRVAS